MSLALPPPTTAADGTIVMPWRWLMPTDPQDPRWANDPAGPDTARFRDAMERGLVTAEARLTRNAQKIEAVESSLRQLTGDTSTLSAAARDEAIRGMSQNLLALQEDQQVTERSKLAIQDWIERLKAGARISVAPTPTARIMKLEDVSSRLSSHLRTDFTA
jgi:hypothetical protein